MEKQSSIICLKLLYLTFLPLSSHVDSARWPLWGLEGCLLKLVLVLERLVGLERMSPSLDRGCLVGYCVEVVKYFLQTAHLAHLHHFDPAMESKCDHEVNNRAALDSPLSANPKVRNVSFGV